MAASARTEPVGRFLLTMAAFVVVVAGMRAAESILVPFLVAVFLAVIGAPPLFWLKRKGVPGPLAVVLVILGLVGVGLVLAALVGTSLRNFSDNLPFYQERLQEEMTRVRSWLASLGVETPGELIAQVVNPGAAMQLAGRLLTGLGGALTNAFLIALTVVFILLETASFPAKLRVAVGDPAARFPHFGGFAEKLRRYLAIKTVVSLGTGAVVAAWLAILGVDFPLLWGLLAFLFNYVPNIGSIIAAIPAVLLGFIQFGLSRALLAALGYVVVNVVLGNIVEPKWMGQGLGLSTLVVFLSLVFWGWVLGPVGMILSIPLTMTVKIALESNADTRWIAVLLGSEAAS